MIRGSLLLVVAGALTLSANNVVDAYTVTQCHGRRRFLKFAVATPTTAVATATSFASTAAAAATGSTATANGKDLQVVQQTSRALKACTSNIDLFTRNLASETPIDDAPVLPPQISFRVFQNLSARARNVPELDFEADDYLGVAAEYAEHAGSARDLAKLSKLGRVGENGSEEVAVMYAKRTAEEVKETEKALNVLLRAVN